MMEIGDRQSFGRAPLRLEGVVIVRFAVEAVGWSIRSDGPAKRFNDMSCHYC